MLRLSWAGSMAIRTRFVFLPTPRSGHYHTNMVDIHEFCEPEWAQWYLMTPQERWRESERLWEVYLELGGTLDPEPDTQSPFFDAEEWREISTGGRTSVRLIRRSGV